MEHTIQLISTDFDGTLHADHANPPVPDSLQDLLGGLQAQGVRWVINTGRDLSSLMEAMGRARLRVRPDFLVLVEREIYVHRDHQYVGLSEWNERCAEDHERLFDRVDGDLPRLAEWVKAHYDVEVYADPWSPFCLIAKSSEDAAAIGAYLDDYCRMVGELTVVRNDVYARLSHVGYSKGTALSELARRLNLRPDAIFAAGDHVNDLPMLHPDHAKHLAAPANAVAEVQSAVRAHGGFVSDLPCGAGVEQALRRVLGASLSPVPGAG
ncbi:MAG: HAD-IIB family hydrolase [Verrucomicrobiales bacterium]|nr:HAD-IIB family hydrolase [Verrucomicrobiales bacterium]